MPILRYLTVAILVASAVAPMPVSAQEKVAALVGRWTGSVKAPQGEMPIEAVFKLEGEKFTGDIKTFHGSLTIVKAERQKDGRWKVSFTTEDGGGGSITGALKADSFAGDWDFRPLAVGTFTLTAAKDGLRH